MARKQERAPLAQRLLALGAVGLIAVATALAFGRVFLGREASWKLLAAGLASAAVGALFERRSLALATLASAASLFLAIGLLVFQQTTLWGLPTRETLTAIGRALGRVGDQARVQISPTAPLDPLLLAAITAVWTATFSAHALAVRAGSPLLATLPPLALLAFADTVLEDGSRPFYAVLFLTAALAVIFADGVRRIRQWGTVWPWASRAGPFSATNTRGARRVAIVAVGVAGILPGILPGFRSGPLLDLEGGSGDDLRLDPLVSIRAQLDREQAVQLFQVTATRPAYWRWLALDEFDGTTWTTADLQVANGQTLTTPTELPPSTPFGEYEVQQTFRVLKDQAGQWLPMAYPAESVDLFGGTVRYDPELGAAVASDGIQAGDRYAVTSRLMVPTREELDLVRFGPRSDYGRYATLPEDTPDAVIEIARRWTEGATTPFQQIMAIQERLTSEEFSYSIEVEPLADTDTLVDFLTTTKTGFCQQFSGAMAVLVRALGYPARVAVGFTAGIQDALTKAYLVTTRNYHSWVEVLFPGFGWLAFEPTPGRNNPAAVAYLDPEQAQSCIGGRRACGGGAGSQQTATDPSNQRAGFEALDRVRRGRGGAVPSATPQPEPTGIPYRLLLLALAVLAGALLLLVPIVKVSWRRTRLRRVREPGEHVLAAYRVFTGEAADLGLARGEGETVAEYRNRLAESVRFSDGHLDLLSATASRAAYSQWPVGDEEAEQAASAARSAIRDIRRGTPLARRVAGIYRPGI